ncbi:MAG: flagellar assembly protein FliW [bacterium]
MKVVASRFGELEVREEEIFTAVRTLPGFPNSSRYFFIERRNIAPFRWMQSADEPDLTFVVVEPDKFFHDYEPRVGAFDLEEIGLGRGEQPFVLVIVVLPEDLTKMTANLKGPLMFNLKERKFKQAFIETEKYTVRESIIEGIRRKEKARLEGEEGTGAKSTKSG